MMIGDTYIIETINNEVYCGFTKDLSRRLQEHNKEKYPHWFGCKNSRKSWIELFYFEGNIEKDIKRFGVKKFVNCLRHFKKRSHPKMVMGCLRS